MGNNLPRQDIKNREYMNESLKLEHPMILHDWMNGKVPDSPCTLGVPVLDTPSKQQAMSINK